MRGGGLSAPLFSFSTLFFRRKAFPIGEGSKGEPFFKKGAPTEGRFQLENSRGDFGVDRGGDFKRETPLFPTAKLG